MTKTRRWMTPRWMTPRWMTIGTIVIAATCLAGAARAAGDSAAGRKLAIKYCSRCHAVPGHNPHGGIGSTPSFTVLTHIPDFVARMRTFYARRPHRAFVRLAGIPQRDPDPVYATPIRLKVDDIDDLVAYIKDLESK